MNRSLIVRRVVLFAMAVLPPLAGCGPGNGLTLGKVSGKVIYKGQPVKNGTVFFMPDDSKGTVGPPAVGSITADGSYVMSTESSGDGAIVGSHKVGITGVEDTPSTTEAELDPEKSPAGYMKAKAKAAAEAARGAVKKEDEFFTDKGGKKYRYTVPKKFSNPQVSGIFTKVERGSNTMNFNIDESENVIINR
jgi:hypothetical protein